MPTCCCTNTEKDIYLPKMATITEMKLMNETEMYLRIQMDDEKLQYLPGQFVEVSIPGLGEAPISISSSPTQTDGFELVVRNVGSLTNAIHNRKTGEKLGIRGPFGSGYPTEEVKGKDLLFICGGIGLVPQRSFIKYAMHNKNDYKSINVIIGTKSYDMRFFHDELAQWTDSKNISLTETIDVAHEKWNGSVGVVTTLIHDTPIDMPNAAVFICGPPIMYKFVLLSLSEEKIKDENIFVNLERRMKCGVGKCGHCQINQSYVCQDGPVYRYSDVKTMPEAI